MKQLAERYGAPGLFTKSWADCGFLEVADRHCSFEQSTIGRNHDLARTKQAPSATIFDDRISNVTWTIDSLLQSAKSGPQTWQGYYFEGDNFYVYIRGQEDPDGDWWNSPVDYKQTGGVLVNCHFDS
jgi:hypothetical protein